MSGPFEMRALGGLRPFVRSKRAQGRELRHQVVVHDTFGVRCVALRDRVHQHSVLADHRGIDGSSKRQCPPTLRTPPLSADPTVLR
jgi:hypothetical protein